MQRNNETTLDYYVSSPKATHIKPLDFSSSEQVRTESLIEDERVFTYERYAQEIHPPIPLSHIDTSSLSQEYPRCLDMPIRLAGEERYNVPEEWEGLAPLLTAILAQEHTHNQHWQDYFTYVTVDCKQVNPSEQQRHGGLHVDGFQGTRINPKTKITRNYVVTTNGGTLFHPKRFIVADPSKFNVFQGFDLQADEPIVAQENVVHFMDAYSVHESGFASHKGLRTFLRVTFDLKRFDRQGNTRNSSLDYDWDMVRRNAQDTVAQPRLTDILNSPYFPNEYDGE